MSFVPMAGTVALPVSPFGAQYNCPTLDRGAKT